jgi:hypothetical protein
LLLLLLHTHLGLSVLADAKASEVTTTHLLRLERLEVSNLQRVKALSQHLLWEKDLSLGKLDKLRLALVLEVTKRADRLVDRAARTVSGLERSGVSGLVHVEVAHTLSLVVCRLRLRLRVILRLSPVTLKVSRRTSAMSLATTALEIGLATLVVWGSWLGRDLRERESGSATSSTSAATSDSHALATTVGTATATASRSLVARASSAGTGVTVGAAAGRGQGELEARSLSLLLGQFGCLFSISES